MLSVLARVLVAGRLWSLIVMGANAPDFFYPEADWVIFSNFGR